MGCKTCGGSGSKKGHVKPSKVTHIVTLANGTQYAFGSNTSATVFANKHVGSTKHKVES